MLPISQGFCCCNLCEIKLVVSGIDLLIYKPGFFFGGGGGGWLDPTLSLSQYMTTAMTNG